MACPVVQFEIEGRDGAALGSFYSDLFGWDVVPAPGAPDYGLVEPGTNDDGLGIGGAVFGVPEQPSSTWRGPTRAEGYGGHVTVYVEVDDVETALARAEGMGAARMQGPDRIEPAGIEFGKFADPEGRLIGVVSKIAG